MVIVFVNREDFEKFEKDLHQRLMAFESELLGKELDRLRPLRGRDYLARSGSNHRSRPIPRG